MAKFSLLSEEDVRRIRDAVNKTTQRRINSFDRNADTQIMSPEVYIVKGKVPARTNLPTGEIVAGEATLPVYELIPFGSEMEILPLLLADGATQLTLRVFNVRPCPTPDDYNLARRDKQGRWEIAFYDCEC